MSTFTRTTTPAFSGNPLQTFVTYKQARRAAKGAGVVALVFAVLAVVSLVQLYRAYTFARLTLAIIGPSVLVAVIMGILYWRIWVKPGPWKALAVLTYVLLEAISMFYQFYILNVVIIGVTLNFSVIAFRGALAMKRLQAKAEIEVF